MSTTFSQLGHRAQYLGAQIATAFEEGRIDTNQYLSLSANFGLVKSDLAKLIQDLEHNLEQIDARVSADPEQE